MEKVGRAIPDHFGTRDIFQNSLRFGDILHKFFLIQICHPGVVIPVTRQFMALIHDGTNQIRIPLRHPAQCEKRRFRSCLVEYLE